MRPNHNNNKQRMRGRHRNNKPSNPLARSYESNGPDVKVRGNPQHIVEKYSQLARDAQVAGDPVLAEAYLQHAEHYYRIIAAAQAAMTQQQREQHAQQQQNRSQGHNGDSNGNGNGADHHGGEQETQEGATVEAIRQPAPVQPIEDDQPVV